MRSKTGQLGLGAVFAVASILVALVVAGSLLPTIVATWANSTYTGLTGAGATIANLTPLFIAILVGVVYIFRQRI